MDEQLANLSEEDFGDDAEKKANADKPKPPEDVPPPPVEEESDHDDPTGKVLSELPGTISILVTYLFFQTVQCLNWPKSTSKFYSDNSNSSPK
jgi:hypothetical protein